MEKWMYINESSLLVKAVVVLQATFEATFEKLATFEKGEYEHLQMTDEEWSTKITHELE